MDKQGRPAVTGMAVNGETYLLKPSNSSVVRLHSLHNASVIRSSGLSVPRTAITTHFR